jgi:hypothetical protein
MYKLLFDTNSTDVQKISSGSYQLYMNCEMPVSKLVISHISCYNTMYNVNTNNNQIHINGTAYLLPIGNYNVKSLLQQLREIIKQIISTITDADFKFYYNDKTLKYELEATTTQLELKIRFTRCYSLFGAEDGKTVYDIKGVNCILPNIANMNYLSSILIRSNLQTGYINGNDKSNILHRLPIDKDIGQIITYNNSNTDIYTNIRNINSLFIQLTDDTINYDEIELNGGGFKIEFLCIP